MKPFKDCGIAHNICFQYDNIYMPLIVFWYGKDGTWRFILCMTYSAAVSTYNELSDNKNRLAAIYSWSNATNTYTFITANHNHITD